MTITISAYTITDSSGNTYDVPAQTIAPVVAAPPVVTPPPVSSTAPALKVVIAQNGNTPWPQDYSYSATDAKADKADGGYATDTQCIRVTLTGAWGGYQPSNNPGGVTDFSACETLCVAVKSPAAGLPYTMQFLMAGDVVVDGPGGAGTSFAFTSTTANEWEFFTTPASAVMTSATKGDVRKQIYKGAIQLHVGSPGDSFEVDWWGGF